ncbi:MAG TPA: DUF2381 family protein [Archangium sp.]|nr:DUF2381 family protein [Archangium sp.]
MGAPSAAAQPRLLSGPDLRARQLVLPGNATAPAPTVCIAPGYDTVLEFDASIDPDSLAFQEREERFALVEPTTRLVVLRPALPLPEDRPLLLKVGFADGLSPTHAMLALVPAAREVDVQVRVIRQPRSVPALETRLEEVLARCEAGSFVKLALSGELQDGVTRQRLGAPQPRSEVLVVGQDVYRTRTRTVVVARLQLPSEARPWRAGEARLRRGAGLEERGLPVWMDGTRLQPGEVRAVAVEWEHPCTKQPSSSGPSPCPQAQKWATGASWIDSEWAATAPPTGSRTSIIPASSWPSSWPCAPFVPITAVKRFVFKDPSETEDQARWGQSFQGWRSRSRSGATGPMVGPVGTPRNRKVPCPLLQAPP